MHTKSTDSSVLLGKVSGLFGVRGWVKIHSYTSPRDGILSYNEWVLTWENREGETHSKTLKVNQGRMQGKGVVVQLAGFEDRTTAEQLLGAEISVDQDKLQKLPTNEYYWSELIGCKAINQDGDELGEVVDMMETGANDVMVVKLAGKERLIPFIAPWIEEVNLAAGVIKVEWESNF